MTKRLLFIVLIALFFLSPVYATVYYISPTGSDSNAGTGTGDGEAWLTIQKANDTITAGDIVNIMAGDYYEDIKPVNSGSDGSPITYQNYNTDTVTIKDQGISIDLRGKNYVTVDGIRVIDTDGELSSNGGWAFLGYRGSAGTYHIIQNCYFERVNEYNGIYMHGPDTHHCQVLYNTLVSRCSAGEQNTSTGPADSIAIKYGAHHNLIEGNTITDASHTCIDIYGGNGGSGEKSEYNIIKDNTLDTQWHTGIVIDNREGGETSDYNLVEGNIIINTGSGCSVDACPENLCGSSGDRTNYKNYEHPGWQHGTSYTIFRKNRVYDCGNGSGMTGDYAVGAHVYNNVFYNNMYGMHTNTGGDAHDNIYKNNIFFENTEYAVRIAISGTPRDNYFINNMFESGAKFKGILGYSFDNYSISQMEAAFGSEWYDNVTADPEFTDAPGDDFTIPGSSPCVGTGAWLTTITSASDTDTSFVVDDAGYFCDGYGIIPGDEIQIEGTTEPVGVTLVDYDTNTITVDEAVTWVQGDGVGLEFEGSAPDIGYYEYVPLGGNGDQDDWPNIYIDESVAPGGDGSQVDPYSDFDEINWTTGGDNSVEDWYVGAETSSVTINLKRGEEWREELIIGYSGSAAYPLIVRSYGTSALPRPIINGADLVATWADEGGNVWSATCTTEPNIVIMDGTKGVGDATPDAEFDWYWDTNVLYVYSTTDPDTAYTDPGIEAGARTNCIDVDAKDYLTFDGLHCKYNNNVYQGSIRVSGGSDYSIIQNCTFTDNQRAIEIAASSTTGHQILNNIVTGTSKNGIKIDLCNCTAEDMGIIRGNTISGTFRDGINVQGNYWIIEHNTISDVNIGGVGDMQGIQIYSAVGAGHGSYNIIRYNTVYNVYNNNDNGDGAGINLDQWCDYNEVYYNICYNNDGAGIFFYDAAYNEVYNNVCYGNCQGTGLLTMGEIGMAGAEAVDLTANNVVKNNILFSTEAGTYAIEVDAFTVNNAGNVIDNNCYYRASGDWWKWAAATGDTVAGWRTASSQGASDINVNPHMIDPANDDFRLNPHSPCINAGTAVGFLVDYLGLLIRHAPDIGAHENQSNAIF